MPLSLRLWCCLCAAGPAAPVCGLREDRRLQGAVPPGPRLVLRARGCVAPGNLQQTSGPPLPVRAAACCPAAAGRLCVRASVKSSATQATSAAADSWTGARLCASMKSSRWEVHSVQPARPWSLATARSTPACCRGLALAGAVARRQSRVSQPLQQARLRSSRSGRCSARQCGRQTGQLVPACTQMCLLHNGVLKA